MPSPEATDVIRRARTVLRDLTTLEVAELLVGSCEDVAAAIAASAEARGRAPIYADELARAMAYVFSNSELERIFPNF